MSTRPGASRTRKIAFATIAWAATLGAAQGVLALTEQAWAPDAE
jgi:hypothetical protein